VFSKRPSSSINPDPADSKGFAAYMERYKACLEAERVAVDRFR